MLLNTDPDKALTEVISKVQQVRNQLPADAFDPVIQKGTGFQFALMYLAVESKEMAPTQVTRIPDARRPAAPRHDRRRRPGAASRRPDLFACACGSIRC